MHDLGHLMTSTSKGQLVLVVLFLGQLVITATTATGFRNHSGSIKVPEEQTSSRCSHLIHIIGHIFGNVKPESFQIVHARLCRNLIDLRFRTIQDFGRKKYFEAG